eukprot:2027207-Amphidinium_carterae.1
MPYRSWCPICVKAKGQPNHHRKGAVKEQSLIQLDYAFMKLTSSTKVNTVLTGVETITGMCIAIPTSKKGATQYQISQLKKFVMENGFGGSILQVDNE